MLIAAAAQHGLNAVLYIFHGDGAVLDLALEVRRDLDREEVDDALVILGARGLKGLGYRVADLGDVEIDKLSVSFPYPVHLLSSYDILEKL